MAKKLELRLDKPVKTDNSTGYVPVSEKSITEGDRFYDFQTGESTGFEKEYDAFGFLN